MSRRGLGGKEIARPERPHVAVHDRENWTSAIVSAWKCIDVSNEGRWLVCSHVTTWTGPPDCGDSTRYRSKACKALWSRAP